MVSASHTLHNVAEIIAISESEDDLAGAAQASTHTTPRKVQSPRALPARRRSTRTSTINSLRYVSQSIDISSDDEPMLHVEQPYDEETRPPAISVLETSSQRSQGQPPMKKQKGSNGQAMLIGAGKNTKSGRGRKSLCDVGTRNVKASGKEVDVREDTDDSNDLGDADVREAAGVLPGWPRGHLWLAEVAGRKRKFPSISSLRLLARCFALLSRLLCVEL